MQDTLNIPTILIAVDGFDFALSLSVAFEDEGFRTVHASDGNETIAAACVHIPDAIIVDVTMPKRSGVLVLEYLRTRTEIECPIFLISNSEGQRLRKYAEVLGAAGYFCTPVTISQLLQSVVASLGESTVHE